MNVFEKAGVVTENNNNTLTGAPCIILVLVVISMRRLLSVAQSISMDCDLWYSHFRGKQNKGFGVVWSVAKLFIIKIHADD